MPVTSPPRRAAPAIVVVGAVAVALGLLTGCTAAPPQAPVPTTPAAAASAPAPTPEPTPAPEATPPDPSPSPTVDRGPALESATWGEDEGGRSLAVVPAPWVRTAEDFAAVDQLWAELVETYPEADSPGMYDQLVCHVVGAPEKDSWNLEPWRPDVGLPAVMRARCNPR